MAEPNFFDQFDPQPVAAPPAVADTLARQGITQDKLEELSRPNYFDQFDKPGASQEADLAERWRLNQVDGYYRGTSAGSMEMTGLAKDWELRDHPDYQKPEYKAWAKDRVAKYEAIVNDLIRYDALRPWGTTAEGATALSSQLVAGMRDPINLATGGARGATVLARAGWAALQQGVLQGATDPAVQAMAIAGGIQPEGYSWERTAMAFGLGAVIGGGLHLGGELISSPTLKAKRTEFAAEDPSLRTADDAPAAPKAEPAPEPAGDTPPPEAVTRETVPPEAGAQPEMVKAAAVKYGGEIFEGTIHADALSKAADKYGHAVFADAEHGFTTTEGRFIGREEAEKIASAQDQIKTTERPFGFRAEHLKQEPTPSQGAKIDLLTGKPFEEAVTPEGATVEVQPEVVAPPPEPTTSPAGRDPSTFSLFEYLASRGGLAPSPELASILDGNPFVPGFGRLIRKNGMSLDRAWEAAARDAKYIFDASDRAGGEVSTDTNTLLRLIEEEARGTKQYQAGLEGTKTKAETAREAERNRVQIERALDDHIAETGFGEPDPKIYKRAVQIMEKEGVTDPDIALDRATMEDADRYEKLARKRTETVSEIPGWDAAEPGAVRGAGAGVPEARPGLEPGRGGAGEGVGGYVREAGPAGGPEVGAGRPTAEGGAEHWLDSLGGNRKEVAFEEMRRIGAEADRYSGKSSDLAPRGGAISVGGGQFDEFIKGDARYEFLSAIRKGATPQEAEAKAIEAAHAAVKKHNAQRPKDVHWQRWEGTADNDIKFLRERMERATGEAEAAKTEPGAEGKPQILMPGVEPITQRQRLEAQAGKPLTGGQAAPPAGGLFDVEARAQDELFMRAPKPESQGYARIAGVEFTGPQSQIDQLKAARSAGAGKDEIQKLVDGFKSKAAPQNLFDRVDQAAAGVQESNGRVRIADVHAAMPDVTLADLHAALRKMQADGKIVIYQLDNRVEITPADRAAAMTVGTEPRHIFMPRNPDGSLRRLAAGSDELAAIAQRQSGARLPAEQARPAGGVAAAAAPPPGASPQQAAAIRSLQQQAVDLAEAIDVPLRQGRIQTRGAEGVYKQRAGVVRVKEVPDFEVVSHEAGHALEAKVGPALTALTNQHATELVPLVSNPAAYPPAQHVQEGFAEYIRRYIGNPAAAGQQAPGFTTEFRNFMEANRPELLAAIDDAARAYKAYLEAPSVDAVAAVRRSKAEEPTGIERARQFMQESGGFFPAIRNVLSWAYAAYSDTQAPLARVVREINLIRKEQAGGQLIDLKAADNPEILERLFARSEQAAVRDLIDGVRPYRSVTPQGPSLSSAIAKATGQPSFGKWNSEKLADFGDYLIARRAEYLWRKFDAGLLDNPPAAFSKADALQAMRDREAANPTFREASDMVHGYTRELLTKMRDGHLIGPELHDKLALEEFYVPFYRDLSDKPLAEGGPGGAGRERTADVVKRMVGSARDIKDPLESLMLQTFLVNRTIRHNDVILALRDLARQAKGEGGKYVEDIPAHEARQYTFDMGEALYRKAVSKGMSPVDAALLRDSTAQFVGEDPLMGSFFRMEPTQARGEPIVFYKEGGQMKAARLMSGQEGHALYETITALPQGLGDLALNLLSGSSTLLRSGIIFEPTYVLTNYIRDQVAAAILRPDYIPFWSGARGIYSEVTQGEAAKLYGYAGGVSAGAAVAPVRQGMPRQRRGVLETVTFQEQRPSPDVHAIARGDYLSHRLSSLHGFMELTQITEAGTRNSVFAKVYEAKRAQGLSEYEAMIEAAYTSQDLMDFSRFGSKTLAMRRLTPFVNAHIQGLDKGYRTMIEPLVREAATTADAEARRNAILTITKFAGAGAALGVGWAALHHDDEIYNDASPSMKGTHFITSHGGKLVEIPKPFELSLGFTAGEYAYARLKKDDPRAAEMFAKAAYEVLAPPVPVFANPLIKTSFELMAGYSFFTGRDIVPDRLQRRPAEQQYTDRTSFMAKTIGDAIHVSPIKVDYAIGGYFGTIGRDVAALSQGIEEDAATPGWEDRVFVRRFIKDPTRSSDVTSKFWDYMSQTSGKYNQANTGYMALVGRRSPEGDQKARDFLARLPENERAFTILKSAANELGKPAFGPDERRLHPLQRAYDAVTVLNGVREELTENRFYSFEDPDKRFVLTSKARGDLRDAARDLAQREMRNAFVIMKEPGYANRALLPTDEIMTRIQGISPAAAAEIAGRYATAKVYAIEPVARNYDRLKREVLRAGSDADLGSMIDAAEGAGYEFGAERVKRPQRRRIPVTGTVPAAPPPTTPPAPTPPPPAPAPGPASLNLQ